MSLVKSSILFGIFTLVCVLFGTFTMRQMSEAYFDRIYLDETLTTAARDAISDSVQKAGERAEWIHPAEANRIWDRFLDVCEVLLDEFEKDAWSVQIPAILLATEKGCYVRGVNQGWNRFEKWETDRTRQVLRILEDALEEEAPFHIQLPFDERERWAQCLKTNSLIAIYSHDSMKLHEKKYYRLAVGGAYLRERTPYYLIHDVREAEEEASTYYHGGTCQIVLNWMEGMGEHGKIDVYASMEDCAWAGGYPCPECILRTR